MMMMRQSPHCLLLLVLLAVVGYGSSSNSNNAFASSLLQNSRRHLEDNAADAADDNAAVVDDDGNAYFEYDLSQFSVRFEKCQYVKMFDDELLADEGNNQGEQGNNNNNNSPLALKHFVIYRCPTETCSKSCGGNGGVYGQYVTDVQSYLKFTVENQQEYLESMCNKCANKCGDENGAEDNADENNNNNNYNAGIDCSCTKLCDRYENLEEYGYVDASQFLECQQFQQQQEDGENGDGDNENDNEGNNNNNIYIGPRCAVSGDAISIGLFYDEACWEPIDENQMTVEDLLGGGVKLSYHLLAQSYYANERVCLTCQELNNDDDDENAQEEGEEENNQNANDEADEDDVNQMCEDLYKSAAKCESRSGLTNGFIQTNRQEGDYENQVENEFMSCNFIDSLVWNSYTETGEINVGAPQDEIVRYVTRKQTIALSFLGACTLCLLGMMEYFRRKIEVTSRRLQLNELSSSSVLT